MLLKEIWNVVSFGISTKYSLQNFVLKYPLRCFESILSLTVMVQVPHPLLYTTLNYNFVYLKISVSICSGKQTF